MGACDFGGAGVRVVGHFGTAQAPGQRGGSGVERQLRGSHRLRVRRPRRAAAHHLPAPERPGCAQSVMDPHGDTCSRHRLLARVRARLPLPLSPASGVLPRAVRSRLPWLLEPRVGRSGGACPAARLLPLHPVSGNGHPCPGGALSRLDEQAAADWSKLELSGRPTQRRAPPVWARCIQPGASADRLGRDDGQLPHSRHHLAAHRDAVRRHRARRLGGGGQSSAGSGDDCGCNAWARNRLCVARGPRPAQCCCAQPGPSGGRDPQGRKPADQRPDGGGRGTPR
mmetsp:Transcript_4608/g.19626  ORF Transcript_4608/g.19626 Transcript_4608/m.19626 type:complete len:283 (+) Transcript_4608:751-1599(+)